MSEDLRLLTFHAHPDDESSKGAGTVAKLSDEGIHTTLVCATGGEEGDILNDEMDRPEVIENMLEVRRQELIDATSIIGYHNLIWLGYRDSGMKDSEANEHPDCFAAAPFDEAVARFASILRAERPHVVVSYGDSKGGYEHPDHVRVYTTTEPAIALAADVDAALDGEPWQVQKLYTTAWSRQRMVAMHEKFGELGLKSPFDDAWFERPDYDHEITTKVEIGPWHDRRTKALLAHRTQVDPKSPFWFGLPSDVLATLHPWEEYTRVFSHVEAAIPEDDLFAGLRTPVGSVNEVGE